MRIRSIVTGSGKHALQVVSKIKGELTIHRHIGTYSTQIDKHKLTEQAIAYIESQTYQTSLFNPSPSLDLDVIQILKSQPLLIYEVLKAIYHKLGFDQFPDKVIRDLVIARVYQPTSKVSTQELLADDFDRPYSIKTIYRHLQVALDKNIKQTFQQSLIQVAKKDLGDTLQLLFYDVTTLAFDGQAKSILKSCGFSKDHRHHDPQIVIGLVVNKLGLPLYFDVFPGKTFEGHTFLKVITEIITYLDTENIVVIADAAMLSKKNMEDLDKEHIGFIVGARLSNLSKTLLHTITNTLPKQNDAIQIYTYHNYKLICHYSSKRASKDRSDRERQLTKAKLILQNPSLIIRRYRFVTKTQGKYQLNEPLLKQVELLDGIKGYVTNTDLKPEVVINRYHDLWRIEYDFKVTKSDLEARPIYHQLDKFIMTHMIIVFAALAICRYIEIKTGMTIKQVRKLGRKVLTHTVINQETKQRKLIQTTIIDAKLQKEIDLLKSIGY